MAFRTYYHTFQDATLNSKKVGPSSDVLITWWRIVTPIILHTVQDVWYIPELELQLLCVKEQEEIRQHRMALDMIIGVLDLD